VKLWVAVRVVGRQPLGLDRRDEVLVGCDEGESRKVGGGEGIFDFQRRGGFHERAGLLNVAFDEGAGIQIEVA
jgi:hypothetical protein